MIALPPSVITIDPQSLALAVGGLAGGILRAACGKHPTWSLRILNDIAVGPVMALIYPIYGPALPPGTPFWSLLGLGVGLGLTGSYLLAWVLWKVGVFKEDPRAARPDNGGSS